MDKFTRESLYDILEILKDLNPKKYVKTDKKIELLEKRLKNEIRTNSDNAEWIAGSEDVAESEG